MMLQRIDRLAAEIAALTEVIELLLAPTKNSSPRPSRCPAGAGAPPRTPWPRQART
jgi:hypothetical protein